MRTIIIYYLDMTNQGSLQPDKPARTPARLAVRPQPHLIASAVLLGGRREVQIDHQGQVYRLRLTSLGKLILTK